MIIRLFLALLGFISLTACQQFNMTPNASPNASVKDLCQTIAAVEAGNATKEAAEIALAELRSRSAFTDDDLQSIAKGIVRIGMTDEAGLCAAGYYWYDVNETVTAGSTRRQYVMGDGNYNPRWYLYTENGVVTAIQR